MRVKLPLELRIPPLILRAMTKDRCPEKRLFTFRRVFPAALAFTTKEALILAFYEMDLKSPSGTSLTLNWEKSWPGCRELGDRSD